jgi:nucleoid DNA-binding protein
MCDYITANRDISSRRVSLIIGGIHQYMTNKFMNEEPVSLGDFGKFFFKDLEKDGHNIKKLWFHSNDTMKDYINGDIEKLQRRYIRNCSVLVDKKPERLVDK